MRLEILIIRNDLLHYALEKVCTYEYSSVYQNFMQIDLFSNSFCIEFHKKKVLQKSKAFVFKDKIK
jgi:hypothetical protein